MKLPSGPGAPAPDAADALAAGDRRVPRHSHADRGNRGERHGRRPALPRRACSVGVAAPASARLEAVAPFGPPVFIFVAQRRRRDAAAAARRPRARARPPAEVLEAVGRRAARRRRSARDADRLRAGRCRSREGRALGADWRVIGGATGDALYLHRDRRRRSRGSWSPRSHAGAAAGAPSTAISERPAADDPAHERGASARPAAASI